jgi:hypothetical protein
MSEKKGLPADIHQKVLIRSWSDPEFRALAITDPRAAIESLGYEVPEDVQIVPIAHAPNILHIEVAHPAGNPFSATAAKADGDVIRPMLSGGWICTYTLECDCTLNAHCTKTIQKCSKSICP